MSTRLPLLALALSYMLIVALTTVTYASLQSVAQDPADPLHHNIELLRSRLPHGLLLASLTGAGSFASRTVQAINFPGMIGEMIASGVMRTWPDSWRPHVFGSDPKGLFVWRGFIFPIYCLPFWWFGGLGLDAFLQRRPLHWTVLFFGTLLAAFFAFITIGMAITTGTRGYDDMAFIFCGLVPWTILLSLFPATWWRTFRTNRKLRASKPDIETDDRVFES